MILHVNLKNQSRDGNTRYNHRDNDIHKISLDKQFAFLDNVLLLDHLYVHTIQVVHLADIKYGD